MSNYFWTDGSEINCNFSMQPKKAKNYVKSVGVGEKSVKGKRGKTVVNMGK